MEISKAKMEGYRVIGIKDTDKEKLANHVASSFSVEQDVKPVEVPDVGIATDTVVNEPAQSIDSVEISSVEPAPVESPVDVPVQAEMSAVEETPVPEEENIFDRIAKESTVAEPSVPETPVVLETPAVVEPVQTMENNIFDNPTSQEIVRVVPEDSLKEDAIDMPAVGVLETPAEFYGNNVNNNVQEVTPINGENNAVEEKTDVNLGDKALAAFTAFMDESKNDKEKIAILEQENANIKAKYADLVEKYKVAVARAEAAETTLNAAIQRDAKTLN